MCEIFQAGGATLAQRLLFTICLIIALLASGFLVFVCFWRLRRHRHKLFVQQLLWLAIADAGFGIWLYVVPCIVHGTALWPGDVKWCGTFNSVKRGLQLLSVLFSVSLAFGLSAALLKWNKMLRVLRWAPAIILPLTVVMNAAYMLSPSKSIDTYNMNYCQSQGRSQGFFAVELLCCFIMVSVLHVYALFTMRGSAPESVLRRSAHSSSRYMLAFFMSWGVYVASIHWETVTDPEVEDCAFWTLRITRDAFYMLNGLFNFLAFRRHVQQTVSRHCPGWQNPHYVTRFRSKQSLVSDVQGQTPASLSLPMEEDTGSDLWGDIMEDTELMASIRTLIR